jgi:hypothetical protein
MQNTCLTWQKARQSHAALKPQKFQALAAAQLMFQLPNCSTLQHVPAGFFAQSNCQQKAVVSHRHHRVLMTPHQPSSGDASTETNTMQALGRPLENPSLIALKLQLL